MKTEYFAFTGDDVFPLDGATNFDEASDLADKIQSRDESIFYIFDRNGLNRLIDKGSFLLHAK